MPQGARALTIPQGLLSPGPLSTGKLTRTGWTGVASGGMSCWGARQMKTTREPLSPGLRRSARVPMSELL